MPVFRLVAALCGAVTLLFQDDIEAKKRKYRGGNHADRRIADVFVRLHLVTKPVNAHHAGRHQVMHGPLDAAEPHAGHLGNLFHGDSTHPAIFQGDAHNQLDQVQVMEKGIHHQYAGLPALAALIAGRAVGQIEGRDQFGTMEIFEKTLGYPRKNRGARLMSGGRRKCARGGGIVAAPVAGGLGGGG